MGSSLARVTCETCQVLLILGDLPFSPHITIDSAQNEIIFTGRKTQIINPLPTRNSIYAAETKLHIVAYLDGVKGLCSLYLLITDERLCSKYSH